MGNGDGETRETMTRWLFLLVLVVLSLAVSAETFRLRNGAVLNGTIKQGGGGSVRIETADGIITRRIIDFDDPTQVRLSRYDTPATTPAPPAAPLERSTPAPGPAAQPRPASPPTIDVEVETQEETENSAFLLTSPDEFAKRVEALKGPSRLVFLAGLIVSTIGGVWYLVRGFQESLLWGIGMILCGLVSFVFLFAHWSKAKDPFFVQLVGLAAMLFAIVVMG
jgi:hypothetical protein